jgi:hypothetical protein
MRTKSHWRALLAMVSLALLAVPWERATLARVEASQIILVLVMVLAMFGAVLTALPFTRRSAPAPPPNRTRSRRNSERCLAELGDTLSKFGDGSVANPIQK